MPYRYRKDERLRKNREFIATMKGKRLSIDGLSLFYAPNDLGRFRVGISVGKKLGNAVARNRLRRRIRDCVGRLLRDHSLGYDLVFVARQGLTGAGHEQVLTAVSSALRKSALRIAPS
jgi:ribonuclease P protein component